MKRLILLLLFLSIYFGVNAQVHHPAAHKTTVKTKPESAAVKASSSANGLVVFTQNCLTCHQADGLGVPRMNPPLVKTPWVLGDQTRLINIVLNGFKEEVEINGDYYSNVMPAFNYLKDQDIADVLTYVRSHFGNSATAIKLATVTKARAANTK